MKLFLSFLFQAGQFFFLPVVSDETPHEQNSDETVISLCIYNHRSPTIFFYSIGESYDLTLLVLPEIRDLAVFFPIYSLIL